MTSKITRSARKHGIALAVLTGVATQGAVAADPAPQQQGKPDTPIKHVIVVIGENRTFDHVFGTYQPKPGQSILNLLSEGIVNADGSPGPNFRASKQFTAQPQGTYYIGVSKAGKTAYTTLPAPTLGGAPHAASPTAPPFAGLSQAQLAGIEPSLEPQDLTLLTTGATGAAVDSGAPDTRITNYAALPNGSFQLTGLHLPYDTYTGDTAHRFYQMWQQSDCSIANASEDNPSGCLNDLYPFVMTTYAGPTADKGGGTSMAFHNMQAGDAPLFKKLADEYTISDNYHQPGMGGTGIQHVFLGTGDDIFWSDGNGNPAVPPTKQIADPNPQTGTNNQYKVDGRFAADCSNTANPGISPIVTYLDNLGVAPNCAAGHYYMINNTNPGFLPNGVVDTAGIAGGGSIPPSNLRTIGDALNEKNISWAYYGGAYNAAVNLANGSKNPADAVGVAYCNICNFESYATSIMGDATQRQQHIKDAVDFFSAVQGNTLPAVSFIKPDGLLDGHPASSKLDLYEGMLRKILDTLDQNPKLKAETAVFITFDEGGGYYDSGYIQPLDFFGDGPRIPMIVVSPFSRGGKVVHSYSDHASILKFIERNWDLKPLTKRSRDNLPNPVTHRDDPYVPVNGPAIGDLFDMFDFDSDHHDDSKHEDSKHDKS